jgi:ATP-dependent DNA helicase RecQ
MKKIKDVLLEYWGYKKFKDQQEAIINSIISGDNALVTLPTGGGKSLCYQLPSLIIGGTTIVISPLIALMEDQVRALNKLGISSFYFKSDSKNLTMDHMT